MKTAIDTKTGRVVCALADEVLSEIDTDAQGLILIDELLIDEMQNPYFSFLTRTFYDKTDESQ